MKPAVVRTPILASLTVFVLAACGGGGGGSSSDIASGGGGNTAPVSVTLSGVAAAGSPLASGTVTLKDAKGATKTATTASSGTYSFDVTGLSAPFVLEAVGIVGGNQVALHSLTDSVPASGSTTLNVTPLTEAMVANVAGGDPSSFFSTPVPSKITATSVQAAQTSLKQVLSSVLTAAGLPADVDLLKSAFVANKTGMDAVLDVVKVSVSVSNGAPVIQLQNKLNADQVVTLTGSGNATASGSITQSTLPDLSKIDTMVSSLTASVANASAVTTLFPAMFDDNYLEDGETKAQSVARSQSSPGLVGMSWSGPVIKSCNATGDICRVVLSQRSAAGESTGTGSYPVTVKKQSNGSWKLYGNHYHHSFSLYAGVEKNVRIDGVTPPASASGLLFDWDSSVGSAKCAKLFLQASNGGTDTYLIGDSQGGGIYAMTDVQINALFTSSNPDPKFRIKVFADGGCTTLAGAGTEGDGIYSDIRLGTQPPRSSELASAPFAKLTDAALANFAAWGASGPLNLSWDKTSVAQIWAGVSVGSDMRVLEMDSLVGLSQATLSGNDMTGTTTVASYRAAGLEVFDQAGHLYRTRYSGCGGGQCNN